jgi:5'-3' exonuclease
MSDERPVLIIDAMNAFVRAYSAYPQMSAHGYQMGGCIGFLKTLQKLAREQSPRAIYVAWEGGGSQRRRALYSEYKLNRKPEKLNRFYGDDIPDSDDNKKHQLISLLSMLKCLPVCQIYVSDCEGDDVVAYLCRGPLRDQQKIVASSDKDMYQLLDDKTRLYSFHRKNFVTADDIFEEYRIKAHNFAVAKAVCGDSGDNVPGVDGVGFKTAAKKFPVLGSDETVLVQDVLSYAAAHSRESAIYRRIVESSEDVKRNWKLVHLDGSMLSATQASKVDNIMNTFAPSFDKMGLLRALIKEGINDFSVDGIMMDLRCVDGLKFRSGD